MKQFKTVLSTVNDFIINFLKKYWFYIALALVVVLGVLVRIPLYTKRSGDFTNYLNPWYEQLYANPKAFLANGDGDYTPTYMYFLVFFSWFKIAPGSDSLLYAIKTLSVLFDFGTSFLIFWMLKFTLKKNDAITLLGVFLALFVPQILLNSAFWGQCDSIYCFFIVLAVFLILKKQPLWSAVAFGVSFAFKLQSVFFFPVLLLLWLNKKYHFWHFFLIPVVYIVLMVPAMICGRSFISCISVYNGQMKEYVYLSLNAPTIYAFMYRNMFGNESVTQHLVPAATIFGLTNIAVLCIYIFLTHKDIQFEDIIKISFLITLFAPYVLPKMHERYFYLAEVFAVLHLVFNPKKFYISLLAIAGSFQGYNNYLFNTYYFNDSNINLMVGATLIGAALVLLCIDVFKGKTPSFKNESKEKLEEQKTPNQ